MNFGAISRGGWFGDVAVFYWRATCFGGWLCDPQAPNLPSRLQAAYTVKPPQGCDAETRKAFQKINRVFGLLVDRLDAGGL